jgi:hypothetical protein
VPIFKCKSYFVFFIKGHFTFLYEFV